MPLELTLPITFSGASSANFAVTMDPATTIDGNSSTTFQVTFTPTSSGTHNSEIHIANNDPDESPYTFALQGTGIVPSVILSAQNTPLAENGGVATLIATASTAPALPITVHLRFSGTADGPGDSSDYNSATQIVIPAGQTSASINVTGVNDAIDDENETIVANILRVTNGTEDTSSGQQRQTLTITDDDEPMITLDASPLALAEDGGMSTLTARTDIISTKNIVAVLGFSGTADRTGGAATIVAQIES